jgi:hypothetical protein
MASSVAAMASALSSTSSASVVIGSVVTIGRVAGSSSSSSTTTAGTVVSMGPTPGVGHKQNSPSAVQMLLGGAYLNKSQVTVRTKLTEDSSASILQKIKKNAWRGKRKVKKKLLQHKNKVRWQVFPLKIGLFL